MELELEGLILTYRRDNRKWMQKELDRLERAAPHLFTFVEHPEVDPDNNRTERALRYGVVWRKISGQIKGGAKSARRMSSLLTCHLTWKAQGKDFVEEIMKAV